MPQLAPMPWITPLLLVFLFKAVIISSLWSHRAPSFAPPNLISTCPTGIPQWHWN